MTETTSTQHITSTQLAREAKRRLGRPASRSTFALDGEAAFAVRDAAAALGIDAPLNNWAEPGASLTRMAGGFLRRYGQAYGPGAIAQSIARR